MSEPCPRCAQLEREMSEMIERLANAQARERNGQRRLTPDEAQAYEHVVSGLFEPVEAGP